MVGNRHARKARIMLATVLGVAGPDPGGAWRAAVLTQLFLGVAIGHDGRATGRPQPHEGHAGGTARWLRYVRHDGKARRAESLPIAPSLPEPRPNATAMVRDLLPHGGSTAAETILRG
jgi:hypothetical protein